MDRPVIVKIDGDGVLPATVPLPQLLKILQKFVAALSATARNGGVRRSDIHVSLTGVAEGSDTLTLVANEPTAFHADRLISAIARDDSTELPSLARNSIEGMWRILRKNDWSLGLSSGINGASLNALVLPDVRPFTIATTKGSTSQLVHIVRAGGDKPTAGIRFPDGRFFTARVASKQTAESLGEHLYRWIEVFGEAHWNTKTWTIDDFRIDGVGPYIEEKAKPDAALEELAKLSKGRWNDINPDEYIRELRSDD